METLARLKDNLGSLRHAYRVTVAEANWLAPLFRHGLHALKTTADDRDRYKSMYESLGLGLEALLASQPPLDRPGSPPTAKRLLEVELIRQCLSLEDLRTLESSHVPNVYCVGAPKSGTSLFYSILRGHRDVSMSEKDTGGILKLADILDPDAGQENRRRSVKHYLKTVNAGYSRGPLLCDFEAGALLEPRSARVIHECLNPEARILLLLRDPVARAVSEYAMRVRQFNPRHARFAETLSFWDAVEQEPQREVTDPHWYRMYQALTKMGRYSSLVEPYLETFGRKNVKIILFEEEILSNLGSTILATFEFLGLRDLDAVRLAGTDHRPYVDQSRRPGEITVSFRDLRDAVHVGQALKRVPADEVATIQIRMGTTNQPDIVIEEPSADNVTAARSLAERHSFKLSLEQERDLFERCFREDVAKLEKLIDRDLSVWYRRYA